MLPTVISTLGKVHIDSKSCLLADNELMSAVALDFTDLALGGKIVNTVSSR